MAEAARKTLTADEILARVESRKMCFRDAEVIAHIRPVREGGRIHARLNALRAFGGGWSR